MQYTEFKDEKLSLLGMGCMRLPVLGGGAADIDIEQVDSMIDLALEKGVNYFDTAWGYHNGESEKVVGASLARHPRDSYNLVSKFPSYDVTNFGHHEEIFAKQLEKCGVDHFDFYLMHNICALNIEHYLDDKYETVEYFKAQRDAGRIRHLGCSVHGDLPILKRFMEAFGECMEFCQIQLNYLDWNFQDAKEKVAYLNSIDMPIVVMEPLRGGQLIDLTDAQRGILDELHPDWSNAEWAQRYVMTVPGVAVMLTGASDLEQLEENIRIFSEDKPFGEAERAALYKIADDIIGNTALPCTKCRYCTEHCPQDLDIPLLIELYNESKSRDDIGFMTPMHIGALSPEERPSSCIGCRSCEAVCPQELPIADTLAELAEIEESPIVRSIDSGAGA